MIGTRHEEYGNFKNGLPFILNSNIKRTALIYSKEKNWHEDLEIQLCECGEGSVLLNGEKYKFSQGDIAVVNSNVIHYTSTEGSITYTCLIISSDFCRSMGIDCENIEFSPHFKNNKITSFFSELKSEYSKQNTLCRTARLIEILLKILIEISQNHSKIKSLPLSDKKAFKSVKATIKYVRQNFQKKITLDEISKEVFTDKYALCRNFKRLTGQTIMEFTNNYRCQMAMDYITNGYTIAEAATLCGFENLSFFTKTFKKYMGVLPSKYKNTGSF